MEFNILYDDNDIVVCVKPQGVISQGDSSGKTNMVTLLKEKLECDIFPIHRLDKETGGVMVFAKSSKSAAELSRAVANNDIKKEYLALVHNEITTLSDTLTDLLFFDRQRNKSYVVKRERKGVKKAILDYKVLSVNQIENNTYTLIKVLLKTGRTHQIRVQFASRGHSLMGDKKYGADDSSNSLGLWAYKLNFKHPITKENLEFSAVPNTPSFSNVDLFEI